jgi:hypothetical protein
LGPQRSSAPLPTSGGLEVAPRRGFSIKGPALVGLAALAIAAAWIFLFFVVIPPVFG